MRATNEVKVYLDRKTQWNSISHGLASTSIISPTLLKQCGIVLAENKRQPTSKDSLELSNTDFA